MSYLGKVALKASDIRRLDVTSSTSATHTLTWTPPSEQSLIITINGIKQQNNYTISGTTLTLDTALVATDAMEVVGILDIGEFFRVASVLGCLQPLFPFGRLSRG